MCKWKENGNKKLSYDGSAQHEKLNEEPLINNLLNEHILLNLVLLFKSQQGGNTQLFYSLYSTHSSSVSKTNSEATRPPDGHQMAHTCSTDYRHLQNIVVIL